MDISRRDFLKAYAAIAGALTLKASGLMRMQKALAASGEATGVPVIWLQGQSCTGCSVSLLNTIHYMTIDNLLVNELELLYHPTVMAAAGDLAVGAAKGAAAGYVLVIEGAIPVGAQGHYCHVWEDENGDPVTMETAFDAFWRNASCVLAVGTCASYGGIPSGKPNPTTALSVNGALNYFGVCQKDYPVVINVPGCPSHPDWIVGTVASLLAGTVPELDGDGRPIEFFGSEVHHNCPNRGQGDKAKVLGEPGCLAGLGCNGQQTHADCPVRQWNAGAVGGYGVNWCIGGGNPCQGCTEPGFPDAMSPFYALK
ncbi:MAG: hydrogenase small subunit [Phycisphaerales bacterium]|nr:MAG: hydrogenase small subunit [Phycisphaerales bacterium]